MLNLTYDMQQIDANWHRLSSLSYETTKTVARLIHPKIPFHLFDAFKLECYVITNENKRRPVHHCAKAVRFSHRFHGFIQGLTGTSSMD